MQALFKSLLLGDALRVSGANRKEEEETKEEEGGEETSLNSTRQIMHSTNTLEHASILLNCMVNGHEYNITR